jgi:alkylmercury lyase
MDTHGLVPGQQLAAQLTSAFSGAPGAGDRPWLWQPLLRLLARGEPVTACQLAGATGRSADQVRQALAALPDTEYDSLGRVVGSGITLNPTPHHFEVGGLRL